MMSHVHYPTRCHLPTHYPTQCDIPITLRNVTYPFHYPTRCLLPVPLPYKMSPTWSNYPIRYHLIHYPNRCHLPVTLPYTMSLTCSSNLPDITCMFHYPTYLFSLPCLYPISYLTLYPHVTHTYIGPWHTEQAHDINIYNARHELK